jgi:hypothetical protein
VKDIAQSGGSKLAVRTGAPLSIGSIIVAVGCILAGQRFPAVHRPILKGRKGAIYPTAIQSVDDRSFAQTRHGAIRLEST